MTIQRNEYVPGVCNIGAAERMQRLRGGWAGLILAIVLEGIFIVFRAGAPWRLFLFLPAMLGATGFLQAAFHFCAAFGFRGVFNLSAEVGKTDTVEQAELRRKDRAKALLIVFYSALIGFGVALVGYFTAAL
jgi:hypothetical protein